nr:MAG TPA: hypothetical protein [Caudoviricetes sp.]
MKSAIPNPIKTAFKSLRDMYGERVVHIGARNGTDYYLFKFPDDIETGFPNVVAYKNGNTTPITGFDAVNIVASFNPED